MVFRGVEGVFCLMLDFLVEWIIWFNSGMLGVGIRDVKVFLVLLVILFFKCL